MESIKRQELFFYCPHCGGQNYVAYDFLYHDMQKGRMIYLLHSREEKDREKEKRQKTSRWRQASGKRK